jgi:hypothetical protein
VVAPGGTIRARAGLSAQQEAAMGVVGPNNRRYQSWRNNTFWFAAAAALTAILIGGIYWGTAGNRSTAMTPGPVTTGTERPSQPIERLPRANAPASPVQNR